MRFVRKIQASSIDSTAIPGSLIPLIEDRVPLPTLCTVLLPTYKGYVNFLLFIELSTRVVQSSILLDPDILKKKKKEEEKQIDLLNLLNLFCLIN